MEIIYFYIVVYSFYILKYMNKYYKMASYASSPNDYLTDDVLEATKFPFKEGPEILIKRYKNLNPKYGREFYLKEIISNAEIKNLVIDLKGYIDDLHQEEKPDGK